MMSSEAAIAALLNEGLLLLETAGLPYDREPRHFVDNWSFQRARWFTKARAAVALIAAENERRYQRSGHLRGRET